MANTAHAYADEALLDRPEPAPDRPIDLVHLAKQTYGERELESELLRLFDRQAAQILARLSDGPVPDGRWRADLAHTLKGSARAVGAFAVAAAAQAYEAAACADASADAELEALASAVAGAHRAINQLLAA